MRRKKGYALLLVIVIVSFLIVLSTIVLSLSSAGYISTKNLEAGNKLKLAAESGIDKGNLILRNYILDNADVLISPLNFNPGLLNADTNIKNQLKYTFEGINVNIEFSPNDSSGTFADVTTGRNVYYVRIKSTATDSKGNSKTVTAIYDKTGINNIYFDRIFKGSFTTIGDLSSTTDVGFDSGNVDLKMSGDAFLQGHTVNLANGNNPLFSMNDGEIKVKADKFNSSESIWNNSGLKLYEDINSSIIPGWKNVIIPKLNMLDILYNDGSNSADDVQDLSSGDMTNIDNFIKIKQNIDASGNKLPPTIVTYKGTCKGPGSSVDFEKLVLGGDLTGNSSGIYNAIIKQLPIVYPQVSSGDIITMYGKFYKLIMIDGDLIINDDSKDNFDNYLIYCTGKVTFQGEAHFYNSSIFAKNISLSDTNKDVDFYGVATDEALGHVVNTVPLKDFSNSDKALINNYLINNLKNYGDYIEYKTLQLTE